MDGSFSFLQDFNVITYYATTRMPGLSNDDRSYLGSFDYSGDLWGVSLRHLWVGENFNPEVGFLRRRGFRETTASARFSPRPESIEAIRKLTLQGSIDYLEAAEGFVESREGQAGFQIEFESSDLIDLTFANNFEFLKESFRIPGGGGITVPVVGTGSGT